APSSVFGGFVTSTATRLYDHASGHQHTQKQKAKNDKLAAHGQRLRRFTTTAYASASATACITKIAEVARGRSSRCLSTAAKPLAARSASPSAAAAVSCSPRVFSPGVGFPSWWPVLLHLQRVAPRLRSDAPPGPPRFTSTFEPSK